MKSEEFVEVGYITKTHGLKGEVQVVFSYPEPQKLKFTAIFLDVNAKMVPYFVASFKLSQQSLGYFLFEDVNHIDKAQLLVKKKVFMPKNKMPKKKKEEFTFFDLEGFTAVDEQHGNLGEILTVREYPQQFLATINYREKEALFPLSEDFITGIDIESKTLNVNLPEGLLDVYLA